MVLEPVSGPRAGQLLNGIGAVLSAGVAISEATLNSAEGGLPFVVVGALAAGGFASRFAGQTYAASQGRWSMPWPARILSWLFFGVVFVLIALVGAPRIMVAFGAFVAIDLATGFVKREVKPRPRTSARAWWNRVKLPLLAAAYLGMVAGVHFTVSVYLSFGTLITWSLLALGFALLLRALLNGPKADESELRAPLEHRKHERRDDVVPDPQRERAEQVLAALRAGGDAGAFLQFVRETARDAGAPPNQMEALEARILASFARAGTRREQDVDAALVEVERYLSLSKEVTT